VRRFLHLVYRLFDLTVMPHWLIFLLAAAGVALAALVYARTRSALAAAGALPLLTPLLALAVIDAITGQDAGNIPRAANEDFSSFGPIGTFALIAAPLAMLI